METLRDAVLAFADVQLLTKPEYLFRGSPQTAVLRHAASCKWFGIIMPVAREKLGVAGEGTVDVLNVKCDPMMLGSFLMQAGFLPAYHMAKGSWLSVLLDGTVPLAQVTAALQMSYALIAGRASGKQRTEPKEWLIPANPKYADLAEVFAREREIYWKQSGRFIVGDTVYIYEGKPIGAITYACAVTAVDVPYRHNENGLHMETAVRIALRARFDPAQFPLTRLQDFGITGVRGPRGIPELLSAMLHTSGIPEKP